VHSTWQPSDRKLNVILYGIDKQCLQTSRFERQQNNINAVIEVLSNIKVQMKPDHIVDCFRLGRFKQGKSRPRPILIRLQCVTDVNEILASRKFLHTPFIIKPDLSPAKRAIESVVLKERYSLIQTGVNRNQIKLRNNRIFVNGKLHGEVFNRVLKCFSAPSNPTVIPMEFSTSQQSPIQLQPLESVTVD